MTASRSMRAHACVVLEPGPRGQPRLRELHTSPPIGVRIAAGEVHLLGTAGGPVGGDDIAVDLELAEGTRATVRSVAATLALPGTGVSNHRLRVVVGPGASLRWSPEPLVAAADCNHRTHATVELAPDADLIWNDEVILGRSGEHPGRLVSELRVERAGRPILHHSIDTADEGWTGPAITAGRRALGLQLLVGRPAHGVAPHRTGVTAIGRLDDDVAVAVTVAPDAVGLAAARIPGELTT